MLRQLGGLTQEKDIVQLKRIIQLLDRRISSNSVPKNQNSPGISPHAAKRGGDNTAKEFTFREPHHATLSAESGESTGHHDDRDDAGSNARTESTDADPTNI